MQQTFSFDVEEFCLGDNIFDQKFHCLRSKSIETKFDSFKFENPSKDFVSFDHTWMQQINTNPRDSIYSMNGPTRNTNFSYEDFIDYNNDFCHGSNTMKYIKTTSESAIKVPLAQASELSAISSQRSSQIKNGLRSKSTEKTNSELNEIFSNLEYKNTFIYEDSCITQEISVADLPECIKKIHNDEAKNFLKVLGDHFFDYLVKVKVVEPNLLRRDSLNSMQAWNALFNSSQRARFANKIGPIKKLIKELNNLRDEIPHQKWIHLFLEFLSTFNPKIFRQQDSITMPERRILYEMLGRIIKEAGSTLFEMLKTFGNSTSQGIESFNIVKAHRSKVVFKFSTSSTTEDRHLTKMINTYIEKSAEPLFDTLSQNTSGVNVQKPVTLEESELESLAFEHIFSECTIGINGQELGDINLAKTNSFMSSFLSLAAISINQFEYSFDELIE